MKLFSKLTMCITIKIKLGQLNSSNQDTSLLTNHGYLISYLQFPLVSFSTLKHPSLPSYSTESILAILICLALYMIQIISEQLHRNKQENIRVRIFINYEMSSVWAVKQLSGRQLSLFSSALIQFSSITVPVLQSSSIITSPSSVHVLTATLIILFPSLFLPVFSSPQKCLFFSQVFLLLCSYFLLPSVNSLSSEAVF